MIMLPYNVITSLRLDLHSCSTLPHPTACDFRDACTTSQANFYSWHIWCMVGPWICTQKCLATERHPCLMVDDFCCGSLPCMHFCAACHFFHYPTISNIQYYYVDFCANNARMARWYIRLELELGSYHCILTSYQSITWTIYPRVI